MRWAHLIRHWSFCSQASSPTAEQPAQGLEAHVHSITHRVLFVRKGSDATDPLPSSGLGPSDKQHVATGVVLIAMAATMSP